MKDFSKNKPPNASMSVVIKHTHVRVIAGVVACVLCAIAAVMWGVMSASAADEKLTLIENHVLVTKGATDNPTKKDDVYNTMSNFATITYDEKGNGIVKGMPMEVNNGSGGKVLPDKIQVKMAGVGSGETEDITSFCTIVDKATCTVSIPAKYMKQVGDGEARPVVYSIFNGDTMPDEAYVYYEIYVSVNVDGSEKNLPNAYGVDTSNIELTTNHTIDSHSNYKYMNMFLYHLKTGKTDGDTYLAPFNVHELFGGDNSFLNYKINKVTVYTSDGGSSEKVDDCTFTKVDNANNQYYSIDNNTNRINGLYSMFCSRMAIRVEATTKTDIKTNIINPKLQNIWNTGADLGDYHFTLMRVNGYEYSCDDGKTWQTNPKFTGLTPGTTYHVLQRPVGSTIHSQRINVTTTGTAPTPPSPDDPKPVVWTPPFNVGDTYYGASDISFVYWPSATATLFTVVGSFEHDGVTYYYNTTGDCCTNSVMCTSQSAYNVSTAVTCESIDTNTGVCTFSFLVDGINHSNQMQNVYGHFTLQIDVAGNIELWKKSSNESITNGNACYSLEGAIYTVYSDSDCNNVAGSMTTNASGYAFCGNLNPGTYWVKETKAAKGYALDTTGGPNGNGIYETYVGGGVTATVNNGTVYDDPQNDPINALIKKNSGNGKQVSGSEVEKQSQGAATYKGAEFTVRYYDTTDAYSLSKDYAIRNAAATRTWVFKTDSEGIVLGDEESYLIKSKSNDLYKDSAGDIVFPVGTYVIEETLAPAGFTTPPFNDRTFIEVIHPVDNSTEEHIYTYHKDYYTPTGKKTSSIEYKSLDWSPWYLPGENK